MVPQLEMLVQTPYSCSRSLPHTTLMNSSLYFTNQTLPPPLFCTRANLSHILSHDNTQRDFATTIQKITLSNNHLKSNLFPLTTLEQAAVLFLETFRSEDTKRTYAFGFELFWDQKFLDRNMTLQSFCFCNRDDILDRIRSDLCLKDGRRAADATRQARAAQYVSFTGYLARGYHYIHDGMTLTKANICKQGSNKTFAHKRKETHATILTRHELDLFFKALRDISLLGFIFALIQYNGARRVGEVAKIRIKDILFHLGAISILPSKSGQIQKARILVYMPPLVMHLLKTYLVFRGTKKCQDLNSFLFSDFLQPYSHISSTKIRSIYVRAWKRAIPGFIPVSPTHTFRASRISHLLEDGYRPDQVQKVTGHEDIKMVFYYGEKGHEANITQDWTQLARTLYYL